jgi:hypothetical protein
MTKIDVIYIEKYESAVCHMGVAINLADSFRYNSN